MFWVALYEYWKIACWARLFRKNSSTKGLLRPEWYQKTIMWWSQKEKKKDSSSLNEKACLIWVDYTESLMKWIIYADALLPTLEYSCWINLKKWDSFILHFHSPLNFFFFWWICKDNTEEIFKMEASFLYNSVQFSSVAQSCPSLCDPMNRSTPGPPVHYQLPEFTQTHVHWVGDAIQPSHPLSSPSPPAPNPSQHQSLFQWVNSLHEVDKVLEFHL